MYAEEFDIPKKAATESKAEGGNCQNMGNLITNLGNKISAEMTNEPLQPSVQREAQSSSPSHGSAGIGAGVENTARELVQDVKADTPKFQQPSVQGPQDWILNLSRALAGTLTPTSMYLNSLAWEAARDKLAQSIAREIRVYAPKSAPSITSARIAEIARKYGFTYKFRETECSSSEERIEPDFLEALREAGVRVE